MCRLWAQGTIGTRMCGSVFFNYQIHKKVIDQAITFLYIEVLIKITFLNQAS
jgi:hypothetical protein